MRPDLVIFDCDGVLVDSEPLANRVLAEEISVLGLPASYEDCRARYVGWSMPKVYDDLESRLGRPLPDGWTETLKIRTFEAFDRDLKAILGVEDVLVRLKMEEIPFCVASSGKVEKMHFTLGKTGLLPFVEDVLFSASMVDRPKPHPDLFLLAAQRMGHEPAAAVVIEDSQVGVTGARAAGMSVFAYTADPHSDERALAKAGGQVFKDMSDLPSLLGL